MQRVPRCACGGNFLWKNFLSLVTSLPGTCLASAYFMHRSVCISIAAIKPIITRHRSPVRRCVRGGRPWCDVTSGSDVISAANTMTSPPPHRTGPSVRPTRATETGRPRRYGPLPLLPPLHPAPAHPAPSRPVPPLFCKMQSIAAGRRAPRRAAVLDGQVMGGEGRAGKAVQEGREGRKGSPNASPQHARQTRRKMSHVCAVPVLLPQRH